MTIDVMLNVFIFRSLLTAFGAYIPLADMIMPTFTLPNSVSTALNHTLLELLLSCLKTSEIPSAI